MLHIFYLYVCVFSLLSLCFCFLVFEGDKISYLSLIHQGLAIYGWKGLTKVCGHKNQNECPYTIVSGYENQKN